jgi:glycerophosphoryl diester phosphodiesterase
MKKLIVAHRGAHDAEKGVIENTIPAFERAIRLGADMVELDVHKTKDGYLIVHHDGGVLLQGEKRPFAALNLNDVMSYADDTGLPIPTFREILDCTRGKIALDIELKKNPGQEKTIFDILSGMITPDDKCVITSFEESFISTIKKKSPLTRTGILVGNWKDTLDSRSRIDLCASSKADFWAPRYNIVGPELIQSAEAYQKKMYVWTVDKEPDIIRFINLQCVYAIITNTVETALHIREMKS